MIRPIVAFIGVFALVFAVLLAAVGQLGKIDHQTLVVSLVCSAVAGAVGAWRA